MSNRRSEGLRRGPEIIPKEERKAAKTGPEVAEIIGTTVADTTAQTRDRFKALREMTTGHGNGSGVSID